MASRDDAPAARSRRERPAKPALTREGVVAAGLDILRGEGLDRVTMRRIAAALDTGPASLYVYVRNTHDLHAQILDALLEPVAVPPGGSWRDRLKTLLGRYTTVLFRYPEMARMAVATHPSGPNYLSLTDTILGLLAEGGVGDREAAWALDLLLLYGTAVAAEQSAREGSARAADEDAALAVEVAAVDAERYPAIARVGDQLLSGTGAERFDWALDVLLDGVLARARG